MSSRVVFIDFETRSEIDIENCGAARYAEDPSTEIIVLGYKFSNSETVRFWWPKDAGTGRKNPIPADLKTFRGPIIAHYYKFEHHIISNKMKTLLPAHWHNLKNYRCTSATAMRLGLPGKLAKISDSLKLKNAKLTGLGQDLIRKYSMPKKDRKTGELSFCDIWLNEKDRAQMWLYNKYDILATEEIYNMLPKLHEESGENAIFEFDKHMSYRGIHVDRRNLKKLIVSYETYQKKAIKKAEKLAGRTEGKALVLNSPEAFKEWLNGHLYRTFMIDNVQAFTLEQLEAQIKAIPKGKERIAGLLKVIEKKKVLKALELRKFLAGAAVKKLYRFRDHLLKDSTIKDPTQLYGAHTLRWAGRGIQPHNIIRASSDDFTGDVARLGQQEYGLIESIEVFNKLLRQLIIPGPGRRFLIGDFASIEARITFWLAGCIRGLELYSKGIDPYKDMASLIFKTKTADINSRQRFVGKTAILGLGFGMGAPKFQATCLHIGGVKITETTAQQAVKMYRNTYGEVPEMWRGIENAFRSALQAKLNFHTTTWPSTYTSVTFKKSGNTMKMTLPSGRLMYYFLPKVADDNRIFFRHPKKGPVDTWGGSIVENIVQATARDLMATALLACDRHKLLSPVLTVHDEIINEVSVGRSKEALKAFESIMTHRPGWAPNLPIGAECVVMKRYCKI